MDLKTGLLVITLMVGCIALPTPEDDVSFFFNNGGEERIVGGTQAPANSHPHMVALSNGQSVRHFLCGGSLIAVRTVLTAAHCIAAVVSGNTLSNSLRGTVGTNRWNSGGTTFRFARHVMHQNYNHAIIKNDIGVLITSSNIRLSNSVRLVPLTYAFIGAGVNSRVAGWGNIAGGGPMSTNLLEVQVPTISGTDCVNRVRRAEVDLNMRAPPVDPNVEVCTFRAPGFGTCNGDSGSALRRADNGQQFGIVSWGFPCARGAPDMFVRVSAFHFWIWSNIVPMP